MKNRDRLMDSKKHNTRKPLLIEKALEVSVIRRKLDFSVVKELNRPSSEVTEDVCGFAHKG